ncbi:unnamed protein product [Danaus chrysippus]|uniref:(African queen) hypothetical protein n=1 Tax=Danaus chrysippus TaxID=151541 RepID=A0A8J2QR49_9NEOP|nr:unnamed protein product [Danaus chrysippus]
MCIGGGASGRAACGGEMAWLCGGGPPCAGEFPGGARGCKRGPSTSVASGALPRDAGGTVVSSQLLDRRLCQRGGMRSASRAALEGTRTHALFKPSPGTCSAAL